MLSVDKGGLIVPAAPGHAVLTGRCAGLDNIVISVDVTDGTGMTLALPNGLTALDEEAFAGIETLHGVELPDSLDTVGARAFADCASLALVRLPDSAVSIAPDAFDGCGQAVLCLSAASAMADYAAQSGMSYIITP